MTDRNFAIGIDFGSLSGRAVLVDVKTGEIVATSVLDYPHGVMSSALPNGHSLPPDWALQHPSDYVDVLRSTIPGVLRAAGVSGAQVVGLGIDFTACTVLPIAADGTPLCMIPEFENEPHAYVKLWKHHSAQQYATAITDAAERRGEGWLARYGGSVSSEWMFPKIWQTLAEAPQVYARADEFIEAGDWVIRQMTGERQRSAALAGYKAFWDPEHGFPSDDFWGELDARLVGVTEKLPGPYLAAGDRAGELDETFAREVGLTAGVPIAVANSDAYSCAPAIGAVGPGDIVSIVGTSTCTLAMDHQFHDVPGMSGCVWDGILPGYFGYEAGQAAVGDAFAWFMRECGNRGPDDAGDFEALEARAAQINPGASGLIALDWWNGNRSVLDDGELSGLLLGLTLHTTNADIYRALLESTAFGMRTIVDTMVDHGVTVNDLRISGGLSRRSPLLMQIYADTVGRRVLASQIDYGPALGSAIFGAVAAGTSGRGHGTIAEAVDAMASRDVVVYEPDQQRHATYTALYRQFTQLHDYFGRGDTDVMHQLRAIRRQAGM